ncbi:DUF1559 family PulG-like putative transporter [Crateriforma conspicua]|uniref:DUF1559 family PulG-like putative transporter n=1 Tax=Crateriforma conspicua TaxID=2527996 RepID=UPI00118BC65B|nr:DUF1559 domain-containing protein [Crateriforma conspicua]QDV64518.1 Methylamine utilization protein MauE [Crateriforma conspicua]
MNEVPIGESNGRHSHSFFRDRTFGLRLASLPIALLLAKTALTHLSQPHVFLATLAAYRLLPGWSLTPIAFGLPAVQLLIGVKLVQSLQVNWYRIASLLFMTFFVVQATALYRGLEISCGCFGYSTSKISPASALLPLCLSLYTALLGHFGGHVSKFSDPASESVYPANEPTPLRSAFTLLELIVVLAITAILTGLVLMGVQSTRESSRQTTCKNRLRQIALGSQMHVGAHKHFPTNGWGFRWVGIDSRGFGVQQPGGWCFNLLPFVELESWRSMFNGDANHLNGSDLFDREVSLFRCPSRPGPEIGPCSNATQPFNAVTIKAVAKTDFAICEGDFITDSREGPGDTSSLGQDLYEWPGTEKATGISFQRSRIRPRDVTAGLSNTYLIGEKHVSRTNYEGTGDRGYDQSLASGVDVDLSRWCHLHPGPDSDFPDRYRIFGSAHPSGFHMSFCDGAVRHVSYNIDLAVHHESGTRQSGARN